MSLKHPALDLPGTPSKRADKGLTLCKRIKIIEVVNGGLSHCSVATKFGVDRTQINNIISEQESIQRMYTEGNNGQSKYLSHHQLQ